MMPPAIVVATIPTVVEAATAVMAPPMTMTMTMSAFDLNHCPISADAQRIRCCYRHSRRRRSWREPKGKARKSDYQKPLHLVPPPSWQNAPADYQFRFAMLTERRIHRPFRIVCDQFVGLGGFMGTLGG